MNGLITRAVAGACLAGACLAGGCRSPRQYRDWVDPCWPQRYSATARRDTMAAFAPQVQNGHVLDQTIWNYHFEKGTDKLTPMGVDKLRQLSRRRPAPDPSLYLATAQDAEFEQDAPDKMVLARRDLDAKRVVAIQKYLAAQMDGRPMTFDVLVHDPFEVGLNANYAAGTYRLVNTASNAGPLGAIVTQGAGGAAGVGGNQTGVAGGRGAGPTGTPTTSDAGPAAGPGGTGSTSPR